MSKAGSLATRTKADLATLARRKGIAGWQTMTKDALIRALTKLQNKLQNQKKPLNQKKMAKSATAADPTGSRGAAARTGTAAPKGNRTQPAATTARALKPVGRVVSKPGSRSTSEPTSSGSGRLKATTRRGSSADPVSPPRQAAGATSRASSRTPPSGQTSNRAKPSLSATATGRATIPNGNAKNGNAKKSGVTTAASSAPTEEPNRTSAAPSTTAPEASKSAAASPPTPAASSPAVKPLIQPLTRPGSFSRLSTGSSRSSSPPPKDRVYLAVNDPYWLHVMWDISAQSVQRAEAALKQDWYGAKLILRLYDVTSHDTTSTSETHLRDEEVATDSRNWYLKVSQPPRQYRVDIGYLSRRGDFFPLAKSNVVTPPKAGAAEALDLGWEKDPKKAERILAMSTGFESPTHPELKELFEERYGRALGTPRETAFGSGATPPGSIKKFFFDIGAKLIVYGRTDPSAHVTLGNDPLDLNPNGTFVMEFSLPDSRQIIPAVATSADGTEERTIVLAIEKNTKYLDPLTHDQMNEA